MVNSGQHKICPACKMPFTCHAEDITRCQCTTVVVQAATLAFMAANYEDCLCAGCMQLAEQQLSHTVPSTYNKEETT